MGFILSVIVIISGIVLLTKLTYLKRICEVLLIIFLWVLFGFSEGADYENYKTMFFYASNYNPLEIFTYYDLKNKGYLFLNSFFYFLGIDFEEFHVIFALFYLFFIVYISRKITKSTLLVLLLYLLWPFFMDVIQLRTTLVELMVFAAIYLFSQKDTFNKSLAILFFVLACTIHELAFAYLPFIIFKRFHRSRLVMTIVVSISLLLPLYANFFIGVLADKLSFFVYMSHDSAISSFTQYDLAPSNFGKYGRWLYLNGALFLMYFIDKTCRNSIINNKSMSEQFRISYIDTCYAFCKYVCCFMPLYAIGGAEFGRIARIFLLLFIMNVGIYFDNIKNDYYKIFVLSGGICVLFVAGFVDLYYALWPTVVQLLENNMLLKALGL